MLTDVDVPRGEAVRREVPFVRVEVLGGVGVVSDEPKWVELLLDEHRAGDTEPQ